MDDILKNQVIDLNFKQYLVQNAIGLSIDEEYFTKNNPDLNIKELKEITDKLVSSYLINNPYEKNFEEATFNALRDENQSIKNKKEELLNNINRNALNAFSRGKMNLDDMIETISFNNKENKLSHSLYARALLASKNEQEYNTILNNGLRVSQEADFENKVFESFFQMKNIRHYDDGINIEGLNKIIESAKSYYSNSQLGVSDFLRTANKKDITGEFIINNQQIITMFLRKNIDFDLIENNEENKNNLKNILKKIIVKNLNSVNELDYNEDSKVLTGLNIALVKGLENRNLSRLISKEELETILNEVGEHYKETPKKQLELAKLKFELKKGLIENRKELSFKEKYQVHNEELMTSLKEKELIESVLDFIDYDRLNFNSDVFKNNLKLAQSVEAIEKIKSVFPNIDKIMPTQDEIDKVQEKMLKEYAKNQIMEKNILFELKEEINKKIDEDLSNGISIKDQNIINDMNSLFKQNITYFSLRALPLLKAKNEEEFKESYSNMRLENKKETYSDILKYLILENEFYQRRNEFGYISNQIPKYIEEFNNKDHYYVSNYILSNNKISDLIIDNFDSFDKILPESLGQEMSKKMVNTILNKVIIEAVVELKDKNNENKAYKLLKMSKSLSEMADCQKTLKIIDQKIKGFVEDTLFYKSFKTMLKDENKNRLKMN